MALPKICYSKIFWTIITSTFAFTFFIYGIVSHNIELVNAELDKRAEIIYTVPELNKKIDKIDLKTDKIQEDITEIKIKLNTIK